MYVPIFPSSVSLQRLFNIKLVQNTYSVMTTIQDVDALVIGAGFGGLWMTHR